MKTKTTFSVICLFIATLVTMPLQAQTIEQKGVTYRYNGKNKRTPIGGVYIKAITANNSEVSDEKTGAFTLALNNLKMGSRIGNVRVTKQGMMVFNQQAVDEWSVRKDPLCLILCNAEDFQKQKDNLIAIGRNEAKKKYDKRLSELKKQNDAKQLQLDEYYNKLDSLEKEYQNALKHMDEYADVFTRIDESEVDTIAQRAIELFNRGEIEESIRLLEQQNYMERIKQAIHTKRQAVELKSTAEQAEILAEQDIQKCLEGAKTQIAAYKLQNEWDKAKESLKSLADVLNTLETIWSYSVFCHNQNDFKEAEIYYNKIKDSLSISPNIEESEKTVLLSYVQNSLANLYVQTHRYDESEKIYKATLEIYGRLAKSNPNVFEPYVATALHNLAHIYHRTFRYSDSEKMYKSALEIRERLAKTNPDAFEPDVYQTQHNLAFLYYSTKRYADSEKMYKSALEICERFAKSNPDAFEPDVALTQNNLGLVYYKTKRYADSEKMYKSAMEIYERFAKANPNAFEPGVAMVQTNLATLYRVTECYSESEEILQGLLEISERLAKANPNAFEFELAKTLSGFANLYHVTQRYADSERMYKSALEIYERLAKTNPVVFEPDVALTQTNLAILYSETQHHAESEEMYKKIRETYLHLYEKHPQIYVNELTECCYWLGHTLVSMKKYHESIEYFEQSLNLTRRMVKDGKDTDIYWRSLSYLSVISSEERDYVSAYKYNEELLPILQSSYEKDVDGWKSDYAQNISNKAFLSNMLCEFKNGERYAKEALNIDSTKHLAYTNLAAAMLFQGKTEEAEKLYRQYKGEFKDSMLDDFAEFERLGIIPKERKSDVERIKVILKE